MPRKPRAEYESGVYHVFSRGNRKLPIYVDDVDRQRYMIRLARVISWMRWRCLSYCLMGNHVHLLVETRVPNLGLGMQRLHGTYAQYFNGRYDHVGHLFQGRFKAEPVTTDVQLWVTAAYIAQNPVEAGLCRAPADWPWSSHASIVNDTAPPWLDDARLLGYFEPLGGDPRQRFGAFVDAYRKIKGQSL
jgi:putative transposase